MKDNNCGYCQGGELLAKFGIKICDLDVSQLILFKEQSKPGRCIVAYKDHVSEIVDISEEERNRFFAAFVTSGNFNSVIFYFVILRFSRPCKLFHVHKINAVIAITIPKDTNDPLDFFRLCKIRLPILPPHFRKEILKLICALFIVSGICTEVAVAEYFSVLKVNDPVSPQSGFFIVSYHNNALSACVEL